MAYRNASTRLDALERAAAPAADPGRIVIVDNTDGPDPAETARRLQSARSQAGPNGTIIEVVYTDRYTGVGPCPAL